MALDEFDLKHKERVGMRILDVSQIFVDQGLRQSHVLSMIKLYKHYLYYTYIYIYLNKLYNMDPP